MSEVDARSRRPETVALVGEVVRSVAVRPGLWWAALTVLFRLAPSGWWRTGTRLPLPDHRWWQFRMVTAYGRPDAVPVVDDVISYLEWCRSTSVGRGGRRRRG